MEREPVYLQTAASREGNDYGTTYAEVNLTAQHLFFYKDGKKILESDFVSGNQSKGYTTPPGLFSLTYKQRDSVLKGEGYASPVKFWMPFNGGIGFHDASWRNISLISTLEATWEALRCRVDSSTDLVLHPSSPARKPAR